jgi:hypothetical protein
LIAIRQDIHRNPEVGFEETRPASLSRTTCANGAWKSPKEWRKPAWSQHSRDASRGSGRSDCALARPKLLIWIIGGFCGAFLLAVFVLGVDGTNEKGIKAALAATGRLSFLLFWPSYRERAGHAVWPALSADPAQWT